MPPKIAQLRSQSVDPNDALLQALLKRGKDSDPSIVENIDLSDEEETLLVNHVKREFEDTRAGNSQFYRNMIEMTKNWRGTVDVKEFPFENSANFRVPFTSSFIEQTKARWIKAVFGSGGSFAKMDSVDDLLKGPDLEESNQWFDWELREIVHLRKMIKEVLHNVLVNGIGIAVPEYEHRTRMLSSVRRFDFDDKSPLDEQIAQTVQKIIDSPTTWSAERDEVRVESQTEQGIFKLSDGGSIEFSLVERMGKLQLIANVMRNETIFDGVKIRNVNLEDVVCPNSAPDLEDLPFFGIRFFMSVQDFRQDLEDGFYTSHGEEIDKTIAASADIKIGDYFQQDQSKELDREEGTDSLDLTAYQPSRLWIEVYKYEGWWIWNKEGYTRADVLEPATRIVAWVCPRTGRCIKLCRAEDLNKNGKYTAVKFDYIREPGRFMSIGQAEWLRHVQSELDAIHNQRIDAGLLTNAPFGFYEPAAGMKKDILKIEPGTLKPVKNAQGVYFPTLNWQPRTSQQDEEMVWAYGQGQGGLNDSAMGVPITKRQSASEFVGTAAALDIRTEMILEDFIESFRELIYRILGLYQQFGPAKRMFRIQGEDGNKLTKHFELDRLQGRIEITLASNLQQVNEQLQRQTATDMLQLLLNQLLIQIGIVRPDTIWAAVDKLAKLMHYDGVPIHKPDIGPESDRPDIEHKRIANGLPIHGPNMTENFQEHLGAHMKLATDPNLSNILSPESQQALGEHIRATAEMQKQVEVLKQMMAAQAAQMAGEMAQRGIRPGQQGGQRPGDNIGPGTAAEGVAGSEASNAAA